MGNLTTAKNNYAGPADIVEAPCDTTAVFNQGNLVKVSSNKVVVIAAVADVVFGVVDETNPVASLGDLLSKVTVIRKGIVFLPLKSGDTVGFDDLVYVSSNVATLPDEVSTSSANSAAKVGRIRELGSVTGDGSIRVKVELFANLVAA